MNADGSRPRRLTHLRDRNDNPAWSPNGRRIAFDNNRSVSSEVEIGLGTIWGNRGLTEDFLQSQRTSVSINGGAAIDTSDAWSQPAPINLAPLGDVWLTRHTYDTGVVLGQGDSMHFQMVLDEPHLLLDRIVFVNGDSGQPALFQPAVYTYDCTVTGV